MPRRENLLRKSLPLVQSQLSILLAALTVGACSSSTTPMASAGPGAAGLAAGAPSSGTIVPSAVGGSDSSVEGGAPSAAGSGAAAGSTAAIGGTGAVGGAGAGLGGGGGGGGVQAAGGAASAGAASTGDTWYVRPATLATKPPMGWSSWNAFHCNIDEKTVEAISDAAAANGLKQAGYEFMNIDDCWASTRDAQGNITADAKTFPDGMKAVADHIHANGLKAGIYSDVGTTTCAGRPGSRGHAQQDANSYAAWGYDYAKIDACGLQGDAATAWKEWRDALAAISRPITFSICTAGQYAPANWAPALGNLWRTAGDINSGWDWIMQIVDINQALASLAQPGHWNDPDTLEVGNGLTDTRTKTHFSLWAMMAAPSILGNDLRAMPDAVTSVLTNQEVIAVDQDPLGYQKLSRANRRHTGGVDEAAFGQRRTRRRADESRESRGGHQRQLAIDRFADG